MYQESSRYLNWLRHALGYQASVQCVLFGLIDRRFSASPLTALRPISPEVRTLREIS